MLFTIIADASGVIGTITTDKNLYDVNDTITVNYNLSAADSSGNPTHTGLIVSGFLPTYNGTPMSEVDYFGSNLFYGDNPIYFKTIEYVRLADEPEVASSFIPFPYIKGTFNAFVKPATPGDYKDFLGKVTILESASAISKDVYVTREQPMVILTNISMERKTAYTVDQTVVINYFCKNNCSITATDIRHPETPSNVFQYGIDPITKQKSLTTSDTGEWKQIVVDLSNSGYTLEEDFIEVKIEDTKGNTDYDYFFVYQPTDAVIRLDGSSYNIGTNIKENVTFNNNIGIVYRTPDVTSRYQLNFIPVSGQNTCTYKSATFINIKDHLQGIIAPNNGAIFQPLDSGVIFNEYVCKFNQNPTVQNITTNSKFELIQRKKALWFIPYWSTIGSVSVTMHANRVDMVSSYMIGTPIIEEGKTQLSLKPIIEAFGFKGTAGYLLFAILAFIITFIALTRMANISPIIALAFTGLEVWYMAYDGIIDWLILVLIVVLVALSYTTKLLRLFRSEPPQQGGKDEGES